jgi:hypothetical protein
MVVRVGTAMPTIWQALRSPSRGEVTIMGGSGVRGSEPLAGPSGERINLFPIFPKSQ